MTRAEKERQLEEYTQELQRLADKKMVTTNSLKLQTINLLIETISRQEAQLRATATTD